MSSIDKSSEKVNNRWEDYRPGHGGWPPGTTEVATYDYHHRDGRHAYMKVKGIRPDGERTFEIRRRCPAPSDVITEQDRRSFERGYLTGRGDEPPLLYKLPELVAASLDELVLFLEGESDVNTANKLGFIATTAPDGFAYQDELSEPLTGRDVAIFADEDEDGRGLVHARMAANSIKRRAARVRGPILMPGGLKDLTAWYDRRKERGATDEQLRLDVLEMVEEASDYLWPIFIKAGTEADMATEAEDALIHGNSPFYVRGQQLVRPITEEADASSGRRTKTAALTVLRRGNVVDELTKTSTWFRYDKRDGKWHRASPHRDSVEVFMSRVGEWRFPVVAGVVTCPTLRPDGTLLDRPGYDEATRLILREPPDMPHIPETPTKEDASRALDLLKDLLVEFPFINDASRSVALSAILSTVARGAMMVVPGHIIRASTPGSGKSYLIDLISGIATGQRCPVIDAANSMEEMDKRLVAKLLRGHLIISTTT